MTPLRDAMGAPTFPMTPLRDAMGAPTFPMTPLRDAMGAPDRLLILPGWLILPWQSPGRAPGGHLALEGAMTVA